MCLMLRGRAWRFIFASGLGKPDGILYDAFGFQALSWRAQGQTPQEEGKVIFSWCISCTFFGPACPGYYDLGDSGRGSDYDGCPVKKVFASSGWLAAVDRGMDAFFWMSGDS